jgi:hypothetical protein
MKPVRSRSSQIVGVLLMGALALAALSPAPAAAQWVQGPAFPYNAIRDGITPTFDYVGSDPTVSPGYDLPIGSRVRYGSSTGVPFYYEKVGFGPTEWVLVQGHGPGVAGWPLLTAAGSINVRHICVDYDAGSDKRRGYVDAAVGSTLSTCSTVAVKTLLKARELIPAWGNGRRLVVLIKARASGATYRNAANTADEGLDLTGIGGYAYFGVRGSDLTNASADRITLGGIQPVAGPGGGGAYTVAGGGTTSVFSVSAGSFGATDAVVGYRWRFDVATTTAALRNVACFINANTGTQITCGTNLGTAPASGDTGYVEQPGVRMASLVTSLDQAMVTAGIACTSTTVTSSTLFPNGSEFSFFEMTGASDNQVLTTVFYPTASLNAYGGTLTIGRRYDDETGAQVTTGAGLRTANQSRLSVLYGTLTVGSSAFVRSTASQTLAALEVFAGDGGSYFAKGPTITSSDADGAAVPGLVGTTSASERATRFVLGPVTLAGSMRVQAIDASNSASSGIVLSAVAGRRSSYTFTTVAGSANATWGIDASALTGAQLVFANSNTITGTSGEVQTAGAARLTMTDLTLTNVIDQFGNNFIGTAGTIVGQATLVSNQSGGALAVGNVVKSNGTTGQVTGAYKADTNAANAHVECVMVTSPASAAAGYCVGPGNGTPYVLFDGAPTVAAIAYLSVGTNGKATTTVPPVAGTNQKIRLGRVLTASGSTGLVSFAPDWLAVAADGAP